MYGAAIRALAASGDEKATSHFIELLDHPDRSLQSSAVRALGEMADVQAVEPLIAALDDDDSWVPWVAAQALEQIGTPEALEAVARYRETEESRDDYDIDEYNDDSRFRFGWLKDALHRIGAIISRRVE